MTYAYRRLSAHQQSLPLSASRVDGRPQLLWSHPDPTDENISSRRNNSVTTVIEELYLNTEVERRDALRRGKALANQATLSGYINPTPRANVGHFFSVW